MTQSPIDIESYDTGKESFKEYLHDLADELFVFPSFRDYQDKILYETLDAFLIEDYDNVIVEAPTGVGKSPFGACVGSVISTIEENKDQIEDHFGGNFSGLNRDGKTFYSTPQKQLRNQLANDDNLQKEMSMLKSRRDYMCRESGTNCDECPVNRDSDQSCREQFGCTYWSAKDRAMEADIAVLTFAMMIVDGYIPPFIMPEGATEEIQISFTNRDAMIVDESHGLEGQVASLFAGFSVGPWTLPTDVYGNTGDHVGWNVERFEDVESELADLAQSANIFIEEHEDIPEFDAEVDQCESFLRKYEYCLKEQEEGRPWIANTDSVAHPDKARDTKKIELKPVDVDRFLDEKIWSRGTKRLIMSATIPFRGDVNRWADRIGLPGETKFISKPMPFPVEHRRVHTNTIVGSMSGDDEEKNWDSVIAKIKEIYSHHKGEPGLIHTASYKRMNELADDLPSQHVMTQDRGQDKEALIEEWYESDKDILLSPSMTEGVDLYEDYCRWQVLAKVPYKYVGDNRVSYLLNERSDWGWYFEMAMLDTIQAAGRAVRGPESSEAASFYVIDQAFQKTLARTDPPEWFLDAITSNPPEHWNNPQSAPWR